MRIDRKIKVLVVDDSMVFRETIARGISIDEGIQVVGTASNAYMARDMIIEYEPDVMTLDVEMPGMNGIEFLKRLMPQYPIPVVLVSGVNINVFEALNAGAVDFVAKPDVNNIKGFETLINELIVKIKITSTAKVGHYKNNLISNSPYGKIEGNYLNKVIAIGASTGGTEAIYSIIKCLPNNLPGIVVVQHIPPVFSQMFAERLNNFTGLRVKEAQTGDFIDQGCVLIAPGDKHMKIKKSGDRYRVECFSGDKVNGHCPSVDVLFESVAKEAGNRAVGIILTGMGYDGAKGLLSMRRCGAKTIGQDEESSVVYGMPKVAFNIGAVEKQVSLQNIPKVLLSLIK